MTRSNRAATDAQQATEIAQDIIIDLQTEFVMVPFSDLEAITRRVGGVTRARMLGFTVELHRIATAQGRAGDRSYLITSRVELEDLVGVSREKAGEYLKRLVDARVINVADLRWEADRAAGESIRIEFRNKPIPFANFSMPALVMIRQGGLGVSHLGLLALYVTLRRICWEQREQHGNTFALITRPKLADALGATPRWVTYTGQTLERLGVVRREEQSTAGGANTTMAWWLLNLSNDDVRAAIEHDWRLAAEQADSDGHHGERKSHDPEKESLTGTEKTRHAPEQKDDTTGASWPISPGAKRPGADGETSPPYARAGDPGSENDPTDNSFPCEPHGSSARTAGEEFTDDQSNLETQCIAICEAFADWLVADTSPAALDAPGSWHPARAEWLHAAQELLKQGYDAKRIAEILADLSDDYTVGDRLHRLPDLPRQIHKVAQRAAHRRRARANQRPTGGSEDSFETAWAQIKPLVGQFGRDGYEQATPRLDELSPAHRRFVEAAGWRKLCDATSYQEAGLRRIWENSLSEAAA